RLLSCGSVVGLMCRYWSFRSCCRRSDRRFTCATRDRAHGHAGADDEIKSFHRRHVRRASVSKMKLLPTAAITKTSWCGYGYGMLDNVVGGSRQHDSARRRAEALLAEGIPLWLNAAAAAGYAQECRRLWQQLGEPHSLLTIKLQAAALIAPSVHGEAQPVGGAASLTADDVFRGAQRLGGEVARGYALA